MNKTILSICLCAGLILLAACSISGSQQGTGGDVTGQVWVMTELAGKAPVANTGISAQFTTDGAVSGSAGCNQYNGKYTTSGPSRFPTSPIP